MTVVMRKVGIVPNRFKPQALEEVKRLIPWLQVRGREPLLVEDVAFLGEGKVPSYSKEELAKRADLILAFGGDGTILSLTRWMKDSKAPIMGVNVGGLGFLTEVTLEELYQTLEEVLEGDFKSIERMVLCCKVNGHKEFEKKEFYALNDVVLYKEALARILSLETFVDSVPLTTYTCDGLIIATPTGSTAHSLSAGGPILYPDLEAIVICPICPHTLSNRPLVLSSELTLGISLDPKHESVGLNIDGQMGLSLGPEDKVLIRKAPFSVKLIHPSGKNYFEILRTKLNWGKR